MPRKGAARLGLTERDARRHGLVAENIAALALRKVDRPFLEQRVAILPRPDPHTSNHDVSPLKDGSAGAFASYELGLAVAKRPVLAFHFDEVDHKVLATQPYALAQAVRQFSIEAPFHVGVTPFVQGHLDHDR